MTKNDLINDIKKFKAFNNQEERDKEILISLLESEIDYFHRDNLIGHFSASAWVISKDKKKVLMCYHNIYNSWSWLGGHADGNIDLKEVALKEAREESGLENIRLVSDDIFSLEILTVDGHIKNGEYVNSHLHFNITYLIEADPLDNIHIKEDENSNIAWFEKDEAIYKSSEIWFKENIYKKLNQKLLLIEENK